MPSLFRSLWKEGRPVFDDVMGETIEFRPQADSELVALGADPNRAVRVLVGIFQNEVAISRPVGSGANTHETADISATQTQIEFGEDLFPAPSDRPRDGDVLALTDRDGSPLYQVESVEPDHFAKVVCIVTPLGSS